MKVYDTVITQTNYDPFAYWNPGPNSSLPEWSPQFLTEKSYQSNDTMGTPSQPTVYDNVGVQRFGDNALELEPCTLTGVLDSSQVAARSARTATDCHNFTVWRTS